VIDTRILKPEKYFISIIFWNWNTCSCSLIKKWSSGTLTEPLFSSDWLRSVRLRFSSPHCWHFA
jgi:hypothetical protein